MKKLDVTLLIAIALIVGIFAGAYIAYNVFPVVREHYQYDKNVRLV